MKNLSFIITMLIIACNSNSSSLNYEKRFLVKEVPNHSPLIFLPNLIQGSKLIHKGIFSPDYEKYYFTVSNRDFTNFNIKSIHKINNNWSIPKNAFFNSQFDDHGMNFSPDGNFLFFSSNRPVNIDSIPTTWHIWRSAYVNKKWGLPEFIDIPNMRNKLVSHPTITNSGKIYFHASNLDYSDMKIYSTDQVNGEYQNAVLLPNSKDKEGIICTPFVAPDEKYIVYAQLIENQLNLMIRFKDGNNNWSKPKTLNKSINNYGQGNPYITSDGKFLFFTTGNHFENSEKSNWQIRWVDIGEILKNDGE